MEEDQWHRRKLDASEWTKFSLDLEGRTQPVIFCNRYQLRNFDGTSGESLFTANSSNGDDEKLLMCGNQVTSSSRNQSETRSTIEFGSDYRSSTDDIDFDNEKPTHRFTPADDQDGLNQMRLPLCGYENYPLVSLEESVRPLRSLFDGNIDRYVFIATQNSREPKEGLTQDESAAIHLYSMQWSSENDSLYIHLNRALRAVNRHGLLPWFPYLKLLLTALFKLPPQTSTVWRGLRGDLSSQYESGQAVTWWGVSSCTASVSVMEGFMGNSGSRTLFAINTENARSIRHHSMFTNEDEIVLLPGTYLRILSKFSPAKDLTLIQMKEEKPSYPLLAHPLSPSAISLHDSSHQKSDSQRSARSSEHKNKPPTYTKSKSPAKKLTNQPYLDRSKKSSKPIPKKK